MIVLTTASMEDSKLPEFDQTALDLPAVVIEREEEKKGDNEMEKKELEVLSENEDIDAPKQTEAKAEAVAEVKEVMTNGDVEMKPENQVVEEKKESPGVKRTHEEMENAYAGAGEDKEPAGENADKIIKQ